MAQGEKCLHKPGKGAFYNTDLQDWLQARAVTHLLFAGVTTEVGCATGDGGGGCAACARLRRARERLCRRWSASMTKGWGWSMTWSMTSTLGSPKVILRRAGGVRAQVCVQTSMREANDRGYECLLVTDATASYFPAFKASAIEMITAQGGIVGWAADCAAVEAALAHGPGA